MLNRWLIVLTLILVIAFSAFATDTRVMTLGGVNHFVKDNANIFLYPQSINFYRSMVVGEVMYGDLSRIGGHYNFGDDKGVVGIYIDKVGMMKADYMPNMGDTDYTIDNRLNLYYGRHLGDVPFGFMFSMYGDSYVVEDNDADQTEEKTSHMDLGLGVSLMENKLDLAASVGFSGYTYLDAGGNDVNEPESHMKISFDARYWYEFDDNCTFVPYLGFNMWNSGYKVDDYKMTWAGNDINLGVGVNLYPDDDILLLFDLGFEMWNETTEETDNADITEGYFTLPYYRVGLEGYVFKWWTVRLGAGKFWEKMNMEVADYQNEVYGYATTNTYIGSGFHFGNLTFDVWMDPGFFNRGPNFVSGYDGDLAMWTSVLYCWGEK
jgi:hypothetical protein